MPRPSEEEEDMRCSLRSPYTAWKTRLFRKWRFENSSLLLVFVSAYVCLFVFDAGRALTTVMFSDSDQAVKKGDGKPLGLNSLTQKMKFIADTKYLKHVDLSIATNDVRFRKSRHTILCFEWDSVKDEIENQIRSEHGQTPVGEGKPSDNPNYDVADNEIVPKLLRILGDTGNDPIYPHQARNKKMNPKKSTDESDEPGLQAPVSPSAAMLKALYRRAINHAVVVINDTVNDEAISQCAFPGFSQEESQLIWVQASRSVRIQHTCRRYTSFLYPTDAAEDVLWAPKNNLGYCYQMEAGLDTWMELLLAWGGEKVDSVTSSDDVEAEARLRQLYPPLPGWRMDELQTQKPLLFTVVRHPFERIVSAYVNHIKRHYRYESSPDWIKEVRGKTFQELINSIRKNIVDRSPVLARRGALNQLFVPVEGFGKHNKIRRQSNSTDTRLNFREFVWLVIKQNLECFNDLDCLSQVDPHWRPQYIWCSPCSLSFDLIIKDESFQKDSNLLLKLLGKPNIADPAVVETTNNSSTVHVSNTPPGDGARNASGIKTKSNGDGNRSSSPAVAEKKGESYLNITSNGNGSNNTEVNVKPDPEEDLFEVIEVEIDEGLSSQDLAYEYVSYLTNEEIKMIYITYSYDFTLFGYTAAGY